MKKVHVFLLYLLAIGLASCGEEKKPVSDNPVVQGSDTALLADTSWNKAESQSIKDSVIDKWDSLDGLGYTMAEYAIIWEKLTQKDMKPAHLSKFLKANSDKYLGKDQYFVLTQILGYYYLKQSYEQKKFEMPADMQMAVENIEQNMQHWFDEKIVYECVDDGEPLKEHFVFLSNGKVRSYFSFLLSDMYFGTWKLENGKMTTDFPGVKAKAIYRENDTMFVYEGPATRGRSLYKIPVTYGSK